MFKLPWGRKERICLVTAYNSRYEALACLTVPRMKAICEAQGYELRSIKTDGCTRGGGWIKIDPIRETLGEPFDWLLWVDIDGLFLRTNVDIRKEIRSCFDLQMSWHAPQANVFSPEFTPHFNTGIMLIRCSDWARDFFARVWNKGQLPHHWTDQATILHLLGYDDILALGPRRPDVNDHSRIGALDIAWNAIPGVVTCNDPIVHHYAGIASLDTRFRIMRMDAASAPFRESKKRSKRARYAALFHQFRYHAKSADDIEASILSLDARLGERLKTDGPV